MTTSTLSTERREALLRRSANYRSRRRRPNPLEETGRQSKVKAKRNKKEHSSSTYDFEIDMSGPAPSIPSQSLPLLLARREINGLNYQPRQWQHRMIRCRAETRKSTRWGTTHWRPYAHRVFPFRQLSTPDTVAVLGVHNGLLVSIEGRGVTNSNGENTDDTGCLFFRLFGMPSRANRRHGVPPSPNLAQVPILPNPVTRNNDPNVKFVLPSLNTVMWPAHLPVYCEFVGSMVLTVATVMVLCGRDVPTTPKLWNRITIFHLPTPGANRKLPFLTLQVTTNRSKSFGWFSASAIPVATDRDKLTQPTWDKEVDLPCQILVVPMDDCFRLTWVVSGGWDVASATCSRNEGQLKTDLKSHPASLALVQLLPALEASWEQHCCMSRTGESCTESDDERSAVLIAFEVKVLWRDLIDGLIETHREQLNIVQNMHSFQMKEVCVRDCFLECVALWETAERSEQKESHLWAVVEVNLRSRRFKVLKWVLSNDDTTILASRQRSNHWRFLVRQDGSPYWKPVGASRLRPCLQKDKRNAFSNGAVIGQLPVARFGCERSAMTVRYFQ